MKKPISQFTIAILSLGLLSQTAFAEFKDVNSKTEYFGAITWMNSNEVINGYPDGSFLPDKCVNRAEFLKMLFKTLELEIDISTSNNIKPFKDTPKNAWYLNFVKLAKSRGTIKGYEDGTFKPDQCVTRVEAIKMAILEFNDNKIPELEIDLQAMPYDAENEKEWFFKHLEYVFKSNSVGLKHEKPVENRGMSMYFYPNDDMSRKEVAEMLFRMKTLKDYGISHYSDPLDIPNFRNMGLNIGIDYEVYTPLSLGISQERKKIIKIVSKLPEVQQKMESIYLENSGEEYSTLHRLEISTLAEPTATDPDYKIKVGEDNGKDVVNHYIFYVNKDTLAIKIIHPITGELMTLEQWRNPPETETESIPSI